MRSGERVSTLAFAGVTLRVRFLEVGVGEVRGVLQRVEVLVAEEFLHVPEVRAAAHEFGRATAAERMRRDRDRQREAVAVQARAFDERVKAQALARAREPRSRVSRSARSAEARSRVPLPVASRPARMTRPRVS